MTERLIQPGQIFDGHGTLLPTGTLVAESAPPGGIGAEILVQVSGTNEGTIMLEGGKAGGGVGASLLDEGTGVNAGLLVVGGGEGATQAGGAGGSGALLSISGSGSTSGKLILEAGTAGAHGGASGSGATLIDSGSLTNSGVLSIVGATGVASATATIASGGELTNTGNIRGTGTLINMGLIFGAAASPQSGVIDGVTLINDGSIVSNGALEIFSDISAAAGGSGVLEVSAGGTLGLDGSVAAGQSVVFEGSSGELDIGIPNAFGAPISGFSGTDALNLTGLAYVSGSTSAVLANGVLTVSDGAASDQFTLVGVADGTTFTVKQDAAGGVLVEEAAQCFVLGTRILTPAGNVAIEDLNIGDGVMTLHGGVKPIKWIGRRSYEGRFIAGNPLMLPVCIKADALAPNVPQRDLHVSPGHALYVDGVLVPAWRLVNGVSITQATAVATVRYLHLELDAHDVIFAEGATTETFLDEDTRAQFANAAEFAQLYPHGLASGPACAPRLDDGFVLHAIQKRIAARAFVTNPCRAPGAMRGYLEVAGPDRLAGWAQDEANPEAPVCLDVTRDGRRIMRLLANRYRADVRAAGLGSGCHGFDLTLPSGFGVIEVVRSADGTSLPRIGRAAEAAGPGERAVAAQG